MIASDVENYSIRSDNAGIGISFQNIGWVFPARSERLMEPRVESRLDRFLVLAAFEAIGKFAQGLSCNDPHGRASGGMGRLYTLFPKWVQVQFVSAEGAVRRYVHQI